jgi:hypothetical protein
MQILNFINKFPSETECVLYFKEIRKRAGIKCRSCCGTNHNWDDNNHIFECTECGTLTEIKSGTVFENSALSLKYWFLSIYMLTLKDKPYTINDIQKKVDYLEDEPVMEMLGILNYLMRTSKNAATFDNLLLACAKNQFIAIDS